MGPHECLACLHAQESKMARAGQEESLVSVVRDLPVIHGEKSVFAGRV